MPLARIDLLEGKTSEERQAIGETVYQALLSIGVPQNDRFQIITEHSAGGLVFPASYLGVHYSPNLIMIQITLNEGRTVELKKALFKAIADGIHGRIGISQEDVFISLVEVKKENWSFGNGIAQYAEA